MVHVHVVDTGPKNERLRDEDEKVVTDLCEKGKLVSCRDKLPSIMKDGLRKDHEQLEHCTANNIANIRINGIKVDIDVVCAQERDKLFSLVMSYLKNQQVTSCVSLSQEEFKNSSLMDLIADAG